MLDRKYAAEQKISEEQALEVDLEQKAKEFKQAGAEVYAKMQMTEKRPVSMP